MAIGSLAVCSVSKASTKGAAVWCARRGQRTLFCSPHLKGQDPADLEMGTRAAVRTNKMLDKISGMYVSKNIGYSKKFAENHERVFGKTDQAAKARTATDSKSRPDASQFAAGYDRVFGTKSSSSSSSGASIRENGGSTYTFGPGPLGLEIEWGVPPVITGVVSGGAAHRAGVEAGSTVLRINGKDATIPMPDVELDDLMQQRPLQFHVCRHSAAQQHDRESAWRVQAADTVRRMGVARVSSVLSRKTATDLLSFVLAERRRALSKVDKHPSLSAELFSDVQTPRAAHKGAPITRWDMKLPLEDDVKTALMESMRREGGALANAFESLAGADAELWELGVVVSEPGAAPQPVHFDAPSRCLFSAFVALQDVSEEMGPTDFLLGTNADAAHKRFLNDKASFLEDAKPTSAILNAGDAVIYDSTILHCGGPNRSQTTRALLYMTFRDQTVDAKKLGIDQHSIRSDLAGRFRLSDFWQ